MLASMSYTKRFEKISEKDPVMPGTGVGTRGMPKPRPRRTPSVNRIEKRKLHCQIRPTGIGFPTQENLQAEGHGLQSNKEKEA